MFKLTALLVGMASVLHRTTGMECVRCVDVKTDISKAHNLEKIKNNIADFSNLRRSECVKTISNAANTNLLSCKPSSALQREHKCGTIIGDVVLHQAYLQVEIPTTVSISGCLDVENGTEAGCYEDLTMLNENKEFIKNFLNQTIRHLNMQSGDFTTGQICITRTPFETGGNEEAQNKSAPISTGYGKNTSVISRFKLVLTLSSLFVYFAVL